MEQVDEIEIFAEEQPKSMVNPVTYIFQFLAGYGWYVLGGAAAALYAAHRLRPHLQRWRQAREDAEYHKDPDKVLARMEAIQQAREKQQKLLQEASIRALEQQKEREEKKRQENLERLQKYRSSSEGHRLGTPDDDGYLPLSGGASTSSYRAPKRSACSRGGCGR